MSPDDRSDNADRHHCVDHAQIAKDRLPTEGGDNVANDPEPGQDHDVDGRVSAAGGIKERGTEVPVGDQHRDGAG